jgi:hypothetical protein
MDSQGYYANLGVSQNVNFQDIKNHIVSLQKNITLTEIIPQCRRDNQKN